MNQIIFIASLKRTLNNVRRRPVILFLSFLQPLIWMTFFGFLFQRFPIDNGQETIKYIDFLLPGICGMTVLLGASQSGISIIRDHQSGFLERTISTSLKLDSFLMGKVTADLIRVTIQAIMVTLLGMSLGAAVNININTCISFLYLCLFGLSYSLLSCLIAFNTESQEALSAFIHIFNMPIFFTSTALVPLKAMPPWMEQFAIWNPLTLAVTPVRNAMLGYPDWWSTKGFVVLLSTSIVLYFLAIHSLTWKRA